MNDRGILKRWRRRGGRSRHRTDGVQSAISLAWLRGWWTTQAKEQGERREEHHHVRPVTPWSHGLF